MQQFLKPLRARGDFAQLRRGSSFRSDLLYARFIRIRPTPPRGKACDVATKISPHTPCNEHADTHSDTSFAMRSSARLAQTSATPLHNNRSQDTCPQKELRCAYVVSKKFSKKAVVRNRARRRLRHALFQAIKQKAHSSQREHTNESKQSKPTNPNLAQAHAPASSAVSPAMQPLYLLRLHPDVQVLTCDFKQLIATCTQLLHILDKPFHHKKHL